MSLFELNQSIKELNQEKKFTEALQFFKDNKANFTPEEIGANKYLVYNIMVALIETNHHDAIFLFIERHSATLDPKSFGFLLKKIKRKPSVDWLFVNKLCDLFSVDSLSADCETIEVERKGEKKPMELASDKENWYAFKIKALFETKQYQECLDLSKKALESFKIFHYSNNVWFARKMALSKKHLGNPTEALGELLQLLQRKKEWCIQRNIAEIYKEKGDFDNAFKYAIDAINNFGYLEYKISLLTLIAEILEKKNEKELSFKHYTLSKFLRQQKEWKVPQKIDFALKRLGYPNIPSEKLPNLKKELKDYWVSLKPKDSFR